jgi:ribosomal protein S18 acetylase RimI-like enzyme
MATVELDDVIRFIAGQQARPDRRCTYVGVEAEGIRAELDALSPPWADTLRTVAADDGELRGAVVVEWDDDLGRSWILGPWVAGDDDAWHELAPGLLDDALAQLPGTVTRHEVCGDASHGLLADLASARGWHPTEANHALVVDRATVEAWPDGPQPDQRLRAATPADLDAIRPLHDAEFPSTYASAEQLLAEDGDGDDAWIVLVDDLGAGYAAGKVQPDGEGYIDFVAVDADARGSGLGRALVVELTRQVLAACRSGQVNLTVADHRAPARALYARLGFRSDETFVAHRSWTD